MHLLAERFVFWGWWSWFSERGSQGLSNSTNVAYYLANFTFCLHIYTFYSLCLRPNKPVLVVVSPSLAWVIFNWGCWTAMSRTRCHAGDWLITSWIDPFILVVLVRISYWIEWSVARKNWNWKYLRNNRRLRIVRVELARAVLPSLQQVVEPIEVPRNGRQRKSITRQGGIKGGGKKISRIS
jgi:hypothetical protein